MQSERKAAPITRKPAEAAKPAPEATKPVPIQRKPAEKQGHQGERSPTAAIQRKPAQEARPEPASRRPFEKTSIIQKSDPKKEVPSSTNLPKSPVTKQQVASPNPRQVASPSRATPAQGPVSPQNNPSMVSERTRYQTSQASVRAAELKPQATNAATSKGFSSYESSKLKPFSNKSIGSTEIHSQQMISETSIAQPNNSSQPRGSQKDLLKPATSTYPQQRGSQK